MLVLALGGQTLWELRAAMGQAEIAVTGGLSPRVAPMADIRDLGALLQRAGFALPVADSAVLTTSYETPMHLMRDLRAMGESNALAARPALFHTRDVDAGDGDLCRYSFRHDDDRCPPRSRCSP